jgi:methyl-accepting chemotaxis protein
MVEESTAASHSLAQETEELARLISRFDVGVEIAASPGRNAPRSGPAPVTRTVMKTVAGYGGGGAVRKPSPAADADSWQEF